MQPTYLRRLTEVFRGPRLCGNVSPDVRHTTITSSPRGVFHFYFFIFILRSNNPGLLSRTLHPRRRFYNLNCFQESVFSLFFFLSCTSFFCAFSMDPEIGLPCPAMAIRRTSWVIIVQVRVPDPNDSPANCCR